jgi:hypothetical protein
MEIGEKRILISQAIASVVRSSASRLEEKLRKNVNIVAVDITGTL